MRSPLSQVRCFPFSSSQPGSRPGAFRYRAGRRRTSFLQPWVAYWLTDSGRPLSYESVTVPPPSRRLHSPEISSEISNSALAQGDSMIGTLENLETLGTGTDTVSVPVAKAAGCPICGSSQISLLLRAPDRFHLRKDIYSLVSCSSCRGVWLSSPPKRAEMGLHYSEDYHNAIVAAGEGSAASRWRDQVKLISQHKPGGAILDIGCSSGGFLSTMKSKNWQLFGIEMEESTAQRARANTGAEVFVGDAVDAPFLPGSFDVITTFDVLEHVYNPAQFLTKVLEWLKPGGIYYAMMPNIGSWEARVFRSHWYGLELPRHTFHFSPKSLRYLMNEIGF